MRYVIPLLIGAILVVLAIIAAIDYFWQRHTHIKQLRMSRQDLKDEFKQTEGSPEVKAKIRRMQSETATRSARQREALDDVANATAVITNQCLQGLPLVQCTSGKILRIFVGCKAGHSAPQTCA